MKNHGKTLDDVFKDFDPNGSTEKERGKPLTIWLPEEEKSRYDKLQKSSKREFYKKLRELVITAIDLTDKRAS